MVKNKRKILIVFILTIFFMQNIVQIVSAVEISHADLIYMHNIPTHIMFYNLNVDRWSEIKCGYICYEADGKLYPAYCLSNHLKGIEEGESYTVTINDLLKNELVYNTILSGYPYKTPTQLGLETEDEAYIATKQAVYSVILNRDVKNFYKPMDEIGQRIINAIYNISENGKKGNNVNVECDFNINKIGNLIENGDNYYQEYSVTAQGGILTYNVNKTSEVLEDIYISDEYGNIKNNFDGDEKFRVTIPKKILDKDISYKIMVNAISKVNPIFYGEAPKNTLQDYAITYKINAEYSKNLEVNIKTNTASIKLIKKDEETLKPVSNTTIELYDGKNNSIERNITNQDGIIEFNNLYQGKYYIKEIAENENYILEEKIYDVETNYNKCTEKTITNKHKKGNLTITKVDKDNNRVTLDGIEFDLLDESNNLINHYITDADGTIKIQNLNIGNYTLRETKTKSEYNLCMDNNIEVKWNETTDIVIENEKKKGQIKIIKEDEENKDIKLEGVEFELRDLNNNVIEILKTDAKGEVVSSNVPIGKYVIKEISLGNNNEYIMQNNEIDIEILENKTIEIKIKNAHKKGNIKVTKIDKDDKQILLEGVEFELINKNGEVAGKYITNNKGQINIENINIGEYILKETETKPEYNLSEERKVIVNWNETTEITIENEKKKGQIEILKTDLDNSSIKLENVKFQIIDQNDNIIEEIITNQDGIAISNRILIGKYYIKEIKTDKKYVLNNEKIKVEVKDKQISKLKLENEQIKGQIKIIKTSRNESELLNIFKGDYIENIEFEIYDSNNNLVETLKTDKNGEAISKKLKIGRYIVIEKNNNKNFLENSNKYFVNIDINNEIEILNIENEAVVPKLEIVKEGSKTAEKNEEIKYEFSIKNTGNIELEGFTWIEYIPYNQLQVQQIITGTYSEELNYNIYYNTNKKQNNLLKQVNTLKSEYIDLSNIELDKGEFIQEIKINFGTVSKEFFSTTNPIMYAKVSSRVKKNDVIVNETELIGNFEKYRISDKSMTETTIIEKEIIKKLPKTGC